MKQSTRPVRTSMDRRKLPAINILGLAFGFVLLSLLTIMSLFYIALDSSVAEVHSPVIRSPNSADITKKQSTPAEIEAVRHEFYKRYGGKEASLKMLREGIQSFGSLETTALRMVRAASAGRSFVMSFAGYSVTVGRGNFFHQSFPFILEKVLKEPLQTLLGISLEIRNAAIGGIPSFPYGWCLPHFLGEDADVVSWDYGMNEGNGAAVLESYLRFSQEQLPKRPMMILLDSNKDRIQLLEQYASQQLVKDAIRLSRGESVVDPKLLEGDVPEGFREWNDFGAPRACPGRTKWHPKKKEHELMGWMIAMHMLYALERAYTIIQTTPDWKQVYQQEDTSSTRRIAFPPPLKTPSNDESVTQLLYGHEDGEKYYTRDVSCRTSFLPAVDHDKVLPSVVVSGMADTHDLEMIDERSDALYQSGWVLDVSKVERDTKKKVETCGGLGYIDMKIALYGILQSGTLRLWLPSNQKNGKSDANAIDYIDNLVICEANEKRDKDACQLNSDLTIVVGGVEIASDKISHIHGAGEYLKRQTCVSVGIPNGAKMTLLSSLTDSKGEALSDTERQRLAGSSNAEVGLVVDITARSNVSREKGACCVSHIIWEHTK